MNRNKSFFIWVCLLSLPLFAAQKNDNTKDLKEKAAVKGLDEEKDTFITLQVGKQTKQLSRKLLLISGLFKTTLEGDDRANEIQLSPTQFLIPLDLFSQIVVALNEEPINSSNLKKIINRENVVNVLMTANYLDIPVLIDFARQMIADEIKENGGRITPQRLKELNNLPDVLQRSIAQLVMFSIPCVHELLQAFAGRGETWLPTKMNFFKGKGVYQPSPDNNFVLFKSEKGDWQIWDVSDKDNQKLISTFNTQSASWLLTSDKIANNKDQIVEIYSIYDSKKPLFTLPQGKLFWNKTVICIKTDDKKNKWTMYDINTGKELRTFEQVDDANEKLLDVIDQFSIIRQRGIKIEILNVANNRIAPLEMRPLIKHIRSSDDSKFFAYISALGDQEKTRYCTIRIVDTEKEIISKVDVPFKEPFSIFWSIDNSMLLIRPGTDWYVYDLESKLTYKLNNKFFAYRNMLIEAYDFGLMYKDIQSLLYSRRNFKKHVSLLIEQMLVVIKRCKGLPLLAQDTQILRALPQFWQDKINLGEDTSSIPLDPKILNGPRYIPSHAQAAAKTQATAASSSSSAYAPATADTSSSSSSKAQYVQQNVSASRPTSASSSLANSAGSARPQTPSSNASGRRSLHAPKMDMGPSSTKGWSDAHMFVEKQMKDPKNLTASNLKNWASRIRKEKNSMLGFNVRATNKDGNTLSSLLKKIDNTHGLAKKYSIEWQELMNLFNEKGN